MGLGYNCKAFDVTCLMVVPNKILQLESFGLSDVGLVREHNEDSWAAYPDFGFFILADGMGGHSSGEIAATEAVDYLFALFKKKNYLSGCSLDEAKVFFEEAYAKVNTLIHEEGERNGELKGMGTTLCSLFFLGDKAVLTHVGDSRIYRMRQSKLEQLTEDHSLVSEMLSIGAMKPEEAEKFPYKHILTRAIGTNTRVTSSIQVTGVDPGDTFMLCSDGLTNYASNQQIEKILTSNSPLKDRVQSLIDLAIEQGGGDNITLILVDAS